MNKRLYILIVILLISSAVFGQSPTYKDYYVVQAKIIDGDTIPYIPLREVIIFPPRVFKNQRQAMRYRKLVRNVKKVYPYSKLANAKLRRINAHMATLRTEAERKSYAKRQEKILKAEFEQELKSLTLSQGKILIKLIDRETGDTSYDLIRDLKGSLSAFLYQSIAMFFGTSLKTEYDAAGDDRFIEEIIILIDNGQL